MGPPGEKITRELKKLFKRLWRVLNRNRGWKCQVVRVVIDQGLTTRHHLKKRASSTCANITLYAKKRRKLAANSLCPERKSIHGSGSSLKVNQD
ncbi:hypothetical protein HispidOSU_017247 [Sigmodon hispidus]